MEVKFKISLFEDYKEFFRLKNGFVVKFLDFCELEYEGVDEGVIVFYVFFGINMKNLNYDIFC